MLIYKLKKGTRGGCNNTTRICSKCAGCQYTQGTIYLKPCIINGKPSYRFLDGTGCCDNVRKSQLVLVSEKEYLVDLV
jgi:hypothetical protein